MRRVLHVVRPRVRLPDSAVSAGDVVVYAGWTPDPADLAALTAPRPGDRATDRAPHPDDRAPDRAPGAMADAAPGVAPAVRIEAYLWDDTTPPASVRDRAGSAGDPGAQSRDDPQPPSIDAAAVCDLAFALDLVIVW